jgi:MFS family permease
MIGTILIRGFAGSGINMSAGLFLRAVSEDLGVGVGTLSLYFSIASFVMILWLPYAGKLLKCHPVWKIALIGGALQGLSFATLGLFSSHIGFYIMTVPQTLGAGLIVNLLGPIVITRCYGDRSPRMLGIQMSAVWLFSAVLQPLISFFIKKAGWRYSIIGLGLLSFGAVSLSALLFLRHIRCDDEGMRGGKTADATAKDEKIIGARFFILLIFLGAITGVSAFIQHVPKYASELGYSLGTAGFAIAAASLGSALGAYVFGALCEKITALKTAQLAVLLFIIATFGLLISGYGMVIFVFFTFLFGVSGASIGVLSPALTMHFYGKEKYEKAFSRVSIAMPLSSILLIPLYGFIFDRTGSYFSVLILILALLLIAGYMMLIRTPKYRERNCSR